MVGTVECWGGATQVANQMVPILGGCAAFLEKGVEELSYGQEPVWGQGEVIVCMLTSQPRMHFTVEKAASPFAILECEMMAL